MTATMTTKYNRDGSPYSMLSSSRSSNYKTSRRPSSYKTTSRQNNNMNLYLLTEKDFFQMFVVRATILMLSSLVVWFDYIPFLRNAVIDTYFWWNDRMLDTAYYYAWWSLLGLLSSSCCALQLLLNMASLGCAGFNTVLGPIRPSLLAITLLTQIGSWIVAYERPWQWVPTLTGSFVTLTLSLLPEFLEYYNNKRYYKINDEDNNMKKTADGGSTTIHNNSQTTSIMYFKMKSVGCSACLATVTNVLKNIDGITHFRYTMTSLLPGDDNNGNNENDTMDDNNDVANILIVETEGSKKNIITAQYINEVLESAGFPVKLIRSKETNKTMINDNYESSGSGSGSSSSRNEINKKMQ